MYFHMNQYIFIKFVSGTILLLLSACQSLPSAVPLSLNDISKTTASNFATIPEIKTVCLSIDSSSIGITGSRKSWTSGTIPCYVKPVYSSPLNLTSYWNGEVCKDGVAYGTGAALWCQSGVSSCIQPLIIAVGVADNGNLSNCPVVVRSSSSVFLGKLSQHGYNDIGKIIIYNINNNPKYISETFIGKFKNGNDYASGAMKLGNKTFFSSDFGKGNIVQGKAFIIESNGESYMAHCDGLKCQKIDVSLYLNNRDTQLIEKAFEDGFLNAAEKEAIRQLIVRIVPRAASGPMAIILTILLELIPSA